MNIDATGISQMNADSLRSNIAVKVAQKTLDVAKQQGEAAVALIESAKSLSPDKDGHIDITA